LLTEVHLEGVTIVVSTPYLDEAERCTRVGLMYRGQLIACDAPNRLREGLGATVLEAQSGEAVHARKVIEASEGVLSASTHGDTIRVLVDQADREAAIQATLAAEGVNVQNLRVVKPRLEDAFVMLVNRMNVQSSV
jgi:drug efflux transport system ATP-binding protein